MTSWECYENKWFYNLFLHLMLKIVMKIRYRMTSWECYESKWFYMKYIGKYLSEEILLLFSALNAEINSFFSSSYNFQIILFLLSLKNWFKNEVYIFSPNLTYIII
jgi:hypothetical protein